MFFLVYLHDVLRSPDKGVSVEVLGWVEPEVKLLLSVSLPLRKDISVKNIRLPCLVTKKLEVYLVVGWSFRR